MKFFREIEPKEGVYQRQLLQLDDKAAKALRDHQARDPSPSWEEITEEQFKAETEPAPSTDDK